MDRDDRVHGTSVLMFRWSRNDTHTGAKEGYGGNWTLYDPFSISTVDEAV
jgi:hypothetical protein